MLYCKKCNKEITKKESYNNLCFDCYKEYLYNKVDNYAKNRNIQKKESNKPNSFINYIKKLFKY